MSISVLLLCGAGLICILYGIIVFLIRSGSLFFLVWIALGGFLLLLAALTKVHFWAYVPRALRVLFAGVVFAGLLVLCAVEGFVLKGFHTTAPAGLDYLIVLGAQIRPDGPSTVLKYRLDAAADYMKENESTLCIVTGCKGPNEPVSEAEGMQKYLISAGIESSRIILEDQAANTVQNIQFSKALMSSPDAPTAIVSNNFHISRAMALAHRQGLTNIYSIAAPSDPLFLPNNMFREFFGFAKDFLKGNL